MEYTFHLTDNSDEAIKREITQPLVEYNTKHAGKSNFRVLAIPIEDKGKKIIGGLYGKTSFQWLFIELLYVPESMRGTGIGKKLIQMAEREAIARGCHSVWVDTYEFQAKGFYEKLQYQEFGRLPNYPNDFTRYFFKKKFDPTGLIEL